MQMDPDWDAEDDAIQVSEHKQTEQGGGGHGMGLWGLGRDLCGGDT